MEAAAKEVTELQTTSQLSTGATPVKGDVLKVTANQQTSCYCCGRSGHKPALCPVKGFKCHNCGKVGHLKRVCRQARKPPRSQPQGQTPATHQVKTVIEASVSGDEDVYFLNHVETKPKPAIKVDLLLEGKPVKMELDTGAPVSLMSWSKFNSLLPGHGLEPCDLPMQTYLGEPIRVKGQAQVEVCYEQQQVKLPLVVVERDGPILFGRQWLECIKLNWNSINNVRNDL